MRSASPGPDGPGRLLPILLSEEAISLQVLVFRPHQPPVVEDLANTLDAMQTLVRGWIAPVFLPNGYVVIANEEGLLQNLDPSVCVGPQILFGPVFVARLDPDDPEHFTGLRPEDLTALSQWVYPFARVS